jgi:hypothetical protein
MARRSHGILSRQPGGFEARGQSQRTRREAAASTPATTNPAASATSSSSATRAARSQPETSNRGRSSGSPTPTAKRAKRPYRSRDGPAHRRACVGQWRGLRGSYARVPIGSLLGPRPFLVGEDLGPARRGSQGESRSFWTLRAQGWPAKYTFTTAGRASAPPLTGLKTTRPVPWQGKLRSVEIAAAWS